MSARRELAAERQRIVDLEARFTDVIAERNLLAGQLAGWPVRRRVVVNLRSGSAVRGVLYEASEELITLKDAELLEPQTDPTKTPRAKRMDGEVLIERAQTDFVQILP